VLTEKDGKKPDGRKVGGEKKKTFKGISKVALLASKLSPKSQRKKENTLSNIAELKVGIFVYNLLFRYTTKINIILQALRNEYLRNSSMYIVTVRFYVYCKFVLLHTVIINFLSKIRHNYY